jgi:2,3-diaminopropionate biosynthesis protein SbnA
MNISNHVLSCIGNTPMVQLSNLFKDSNLEVYAKLELLNPGGSVKDRPAKYIIEEGIRDGIIIPGVSHVIESSSGNLAIALAMQCKRYGIKFTCVVDPKISAANYTIVKMLGANLIMVNTLDDNGGYLGTRIKKIEELVRSNEKMIWVNQYANPSNWKSHYYGEGQEIIEQLPVEIDYLVMGVSTSGTLLGIARRLKEVWPNMKVIAVDAVGSVLFGANPQPRELPGIGASRVPELLKPEEIDQVIYVDDYEAAIACRELVEQECIFAGGSSGSAIAAIKKLSQTIDSCSHVVTLLADRGERYLDMVYDDKWFDEVTKRHFSKPDYTQPKNIMEAECV